MVYKALHNQLPSYICDSFRYVSDIHSRTTRESLKRDLYVRTRARLACYRHSLCYAGAEQWNYLPLNVREAPSVTIFKERYFKMHFK